MNTFLNVFSVLGGLAMFLYGMALMSEGLQKSAGDRLRAFMAKMTSNAFKRVLTGTVVTCLVQSSSATTIMVVSFVNAGLLTLGNAIGVIMGANIGTTLTAWITSLGFSVNIALFAVPMMGVGFVLHSSKKATMKNIGQFLMGFAVMYVGLTFMKDCSNAILGQYQTGMMSFFGSINGFGFGSIILFLIAGAVLTIVLQASSATMAITMLLAASGLIDFKLAVAMVLGENIGTTITANIAAAVANTSAKRAARAHTIFNIIGVIWVLAVFGPIVKLICMIMESLNFCNPMEVRRSFHADQSVLLLAGHGTLEDLADFDPTRANASYLAYKARAMRRAADELEYANRLLIEKLSDMVVQDMKARNLDKSKIKDALKTYEAYRVMRRKDQNAVAKMVEKAFAKMEASKK